MGHVAPPTEAGSPEQAHAATLSSRAGDSASWAGRARTVATKAWGQCVDVVFSIAACARLCAVALATHELGVQQT